MKKAALLMQSAINGGVQRIMINLAQGMSEQGIKIDFLIADAEGEMKALLPPNCNVYDFKKKKYHGDMKVLMSIFLISKYMNQNPQTTIFAAPGLSCTIAAVLKIFHSKTNVILINDNKCSLLKSKGIYHKIVYYINKIVYRFADKIVAAHMSAMKDISEHYHIKTSKMCMIYHPLIDAEIIKASRPEHTHPFIQEKEKGYKIILAAGRLVREKAFDILIDAFALIRTDTKVKLIILGEGSERSILQKKIEQAGLQKDINLYGYTSQVYSFMKSADLFVLSSRQEAFGNVLIEAIACGLPCAATDCESGGPREIMEKYGVGNYGVLCKRENVKSLAEAIKTALTEKYEQKYFQEKTKLFTIEYSAKQYIENMKEY